MTLGASTLHKALVLDEMGKKEEEEELRRILSVQIEDVHIAT